MTYYDPHKLQIALLPPGTMMLSDVMARVASDISLSADRCRDILSGLRRVADALNMPPQSIPADMQWLQKRLATVLPASMGLTAKSWSNIMSNTGAGLALCGMRQRRIHRRSDLSPSWKALWEMVLASGDKTIGRSLCGFVYFLNHLCVEPQDVTFGHAEAYRDALVQSELRKSPDHGFRVAVNSWNLASRRFPAWPQRIFDLPSRAHIIKLKPEAFPPTFIADMDTYLNSLRDPDIFALDAVARPLRPASIDQYRAILLRFASTLVLAGVPVGEIHDLSSLVTMTNVRKGIGWMQEATGKRITIGLADTVRVLRTVAKRYVKVDEAHQQQLDQLNAKTRKVHASDMTPKNRERLRPLVDPKTRRRLLVLPGQLFERSIKLGTTKASASLKEDAIAIAILSYCPIRRKNLFDIHLERNLQRPRDGRVFLVFEKDEVKNAMRIEFELPPHVVKMIDDHLETRSGHLCPAGTPWLFARRDGSGPGCANYLCTKVKKRIEKEVGLTFNLHLFRHFAGQNLLNAKPGQYELLKRLLGHAKLSATTNLYAGLDAARSVQLYADVVNEAMEE